MRLEKQKQAHVLYSGQKNESIGMSLDMDSAQVLMQMLSKNLYSDSIGSTIRECASNALDSHRRAGVNKPIVVSLVQNDSNNWEFSVEDFGTGLDHYDVENIISKYGKSTKRNSDTELGMMGLGFKAPLAYASSFYFTCRKDGMERKYMMYEGEETNTIDLISETDTTEDNGVKVIVPIKWGDRHDFLKKIKQQLAYFEDVYFNVDDVDNNFTIHRSKLFQFSELADDEKLHICLDNVYYPIDFDKLGIDIIYIPVGLTFKITDGLFPTPNRESLIYTKETKSKILKKLAEFSDYFVEKYNENVTDSDDVKGYLDYYYNSSREVQLHGKVVDLNNLKDYITVPFAKPKLEGVDNWDISTFARHEFNYLLGEYKCSYRYENTRMYQVKESNWGRSVSWNDMDKYHFKMQDGMRGHKKAYLRELCEDMVTAPRINGRNLSRVSFIRKTKSYPLTSTNNKDCYYDILKLTNYPKSQWRSVIKDFQYVESLLLNPIKDADLITPPQDWIDDRKANTVSKMRATKAAKGEKVEGDFTCKKAEQLLRYNDGRNCKFVSHRINIEAIETGGDTYVYTKHDDYMKLDDLYEETQRMRIKYITFSQRELDALNKSPKITNLVSYDDFINGDEMFVRFITALYCHRFIQTKDISDIFDKSDDIDKVKTKLSAQLKEVQEYCRAYIKGGRYESYKHGYKLLDHAEENDLFSAKIYDLVQELESFFIEHPYVNNIASVLGSHRQQDGLLDCLAQLFKCNGVPINSYYQFVKHKQEEQEQE